MNNISYFEIQASDPEKLVEFYKTIFAWEFERDSNIPIEYYRITGAGAPGAILKRPTKTPETMQGTNAYTCSIEIENFDETERKIMYHGGKVAMEKFAIPGKCWQGYFLDLDNNVFGIFEVDTEAR